MVTTYNPPTIAELKDAINELSRAQAQILKHEHDAEQLAVFEEQVYAARDQLDQLIQRIGLKK